MKAILLADPDNSRVTEGMDPSDPAVWDISDEEKTAKAAAAPNIYRPYPLQQKYFEHVGYRWTIPYLVGNAAVDVFIDAYAWLKDKILPDRDEKDPEEEGQNTDSGDSTDQQDGQDSQGKPEQEDDAGKSGSEDEEKETDSSDDTGRKEPGSCGDREARDGQKACASGMSGSIVSLSSAGSDGASVPTCYEIRISMDPDKVLDEDHHLRQQYFDEFGLSEDYERYGAVYFETPDRAFDSEGWEGTICMREDEEADSFELTFKKRYPVSGEDIDGALCLARADGFDPADQTWNPCIEWGYSGLSLSLSAKRECPAQGCRTIADLSRSDAAQMLIEYALEIEGNRKAEDWGSRAVTEAGIAGPVYFNRYTGRFEDHKVEIEVWEIPDGDTGSFRYLVYMVPWYQVPLSPFK